VLYYKYMNELERVLKAMANRRRLALIKHLRSQREASVGELAEAIKLSLKATSKHLVILHNLGIVERDQRSLLMYYRLADPLPRPVKSLLSYL